VLPGQLVDDCWSSCLDYDKKNGYCKKTGGRDEQGRLIPDPVKFPDGSEPLSTKHTLALVPRTVY
jgi:hypothetical protein